MCDKVCVTNGGRAEEEEEYGRRSGRDGESKTITPHNDMGRKRSPASQGSHQATAPSEALGLPEPAWQGRCQCQSNISARANMHSVIRKNACISLCICMCIYNHQTRFKKKFSSKTSELQTNVHRQSCRQASYRGTVATAVGRWEQPITVAMPEHVHLRVKPSKAGSCFSCGPRFEKTAVEKCAMRP